MLKVAINGYGRIGRIAHRVILEKHVSEIEVAGINVGPLADIKLWENLLKYDTAYGSLGHNLKTQVSKPKYPNLKDYIGSLIIDDKEIPVLSQKDPTLLPWKDLNVDIVLECSGLFRTEEKLKMHLQAGAKAVVLSAPAKEGNVPTYVLGVNSNEYKGEKIINNASCTTNCIAPVVKIMSDHFGVEKAMMTTVHAYTADQSLQDGEHKDYRRARAAASNIVPTSTGAAKTVAKVIPGLEGNFTGLALRVPVVVGSLSDITFVLKKQTTEEEINEVFKNETQGPAYKNILEVTDEPIVSSDIIRNPHSAIVDLSLTQVVGGNLVKVIAWYDNEYGYANRLVEEAIMVGKSQISNPK